MVNIAFALLKAVHGFDELRSWSGGAAWTGALGRGHRPAVAGTGAAVEAGDFCRLACVMGVPGSLAVRWTLRSLLCLFAIAGGAALFAGLLVLQATFAFGVLESLEVFNTVTYGARDHPVSALVYKREFAGSLRPCCLWPSRYFRVAILGRVDPLGSAPIFSA